MRAGLRPFSRLPSWQRQPVITRGARSCSLPGLIRNTPQHSQPTLRAPEEGTTSTTNGTTPACRIAAGTDLSSAQDWNGIGTALQNAGRYGEARTAFREARRLAPHDSDIVLNLANLEMECGRHQHAYDLFQIVLRKRPLLATARIRAARTCYELGRKKRARPLIRAWHQWHLDVDATAELGALLTQIGNPRDGLSILDGLSDLSQVSPRVVAYVVTALEQARCLDRARQWAIFLPSPAQTANQALREEILAWHARLAWRDGDLATARKLLGFLDTPHVVGGCRNAKPYLLLAEVCFQQSDYEAAESAQAKARSVLMKAADTACLRSHCHMRRTVRTSKAVTMNVLPMTTLA